MLYVQFECGSEDRVSLKYGPYPWVQLTYEMLRVGPDGDDLAFVTDQFMWHVIGNNEQEAWSDVVIG